MHAALDVAFEEMGVFDRKLAGMLGRIGGMASRLRADGGVPIMTGDFAGGRSWLPNPHDP